MLTDRGEVDEAETWYRRAAEAGHLAAACNFGRSLHARGETDEAELGIVTPLTRANRMQCSVSRKLPFCEVNLTKWKLEYSALPMRDFHKRCAPSVLP
ncbi:hypothetical protein AB0H49_09080 [Nocardia sp. NPDC050713]|uniref:hypothetical protein n=1 Tax=Nocardia sp. NPDC050713 TaxID=3154511 RepID=UPI0033CB984D